MKKLILMFLVLSGPTKNAKAFGISECLIKVSSLIPLDIYFTPHRYRETKKKAIQLAKAFHRDQLYDHYQYDYHLSAVEKVLRRFGFNPHESQDHRKLIIAAWLHDIIEDTNISVEIIKSLFGDDITNIVLGVTKATNSPDLSAQRRDMITLERIKYTHRLSVILKLADRIANVEYGLQNNQLKSKYVDSYPEFRAFLFDPENKKALPLWSHLDNLLGFVDN